MDQIIRLIGVTIAVFGLFFSLLIGGPAMVSIAGLIAHLIVGT